MIDALLHAVKDNLRREVPGWTPANCEVMADGQPPPYSGDWFAAIHQAGSRSTMMNALDERFDFSVTLTVKVGGVPLDRVGNKLLAVPLARDLALKTGWNARAEQIRAFLHMAWGVLQEANTLLSTWEPGNIPVYGFCEPAHFAGMDMPYLVGGEWFAAQPEAQDVGLVGEIKFADCRRLQAIASYA